MIIRVEESEELLIDILQLLGVDFVVSTKEGYDEYYLSVPPKQAA